MVRCFGFLFTLIVAAILTACNQGPEKKLPSAHFIMPEGNLYLATAELCGTVAMDEAERGRWRRWLTADERLAAAPQRQDPRWGTVVIIQPGIYHVPSDLCEDEGMALWVKIVLGIFLAALAVLFVGGLARSSRGQAPSPPRAPTVRVVRP